MNRQASYARKTNETDIEVSLALDGAAGFSGSCGIGFLDHLLSALARHGGLSLGLRCTGDLHVDGHHTAEDVGLCLGEALALALGEMRGIERFGEAAVPMDEALARVALDISGRPYLALACDPLPPMIGDLDAQLIEEFLRAFAQKARITLHAEARGTNGHHIAEALFKALGRALRKAVAITDASGAVPLDQGGAVMDFMLYPAVDMKRGRCVRLLQGRAEDATDYGDPLEAALRWKAEGAQWLHMVDLDGAFGGAEAGGENLVAVACAVRESGLFVQLGGGVRTEEDAAYRLEELGVARVVLGTVAVEEPETAIRIARRFPYRVALGVDARGGKVSARGWTQDSALDAVEFAKRMAGEGFMHIIFTDIARDGMMRGANAEATAELVRAVPGVGVIGSGGVASLNDLRALRDAGCAGAITGKAIYEGAFTLREALGYRGSMI